MGTGVLDAWSHVAERRTRPHSLLLVVSVVVQRAAQQQQLLVGLVAGGAAAAALVGAGEHLGRQGGHARAVRLGAGALGQVEEAVQLAGRGAGGDLRTEVEADTDGLPRKC